jgi:hypothetical protein
MNPRIGKRAAGNQQEYKPVAKAVLFIKQNTKKNITLKQEYLYLEDVKKALNIHHLETHIKLKRWMAEKLKSEAGNTKWINILEESADKDRHKLQKLFKIKF